VSLGAVGLETILQPLPVFCSINTPELLEPTAQQSVALTQLTLWSKAFSASPGGLGLETMLHGRGGAGVALVGGADGELTDGEAVVDGVLVETPEA
jgi:hypothetical protein